MKFLNSKGIIILCIALIIISVVFFSIIYLINKVDGESYDDALYTSIQIQTSIGLDNNISNRASIRNWITVQSIITYILNIALVVFLGTILVKM
jgi:hypothetical protein